MVLVEKLKVTDNYEEQNRIIAYLRAYIYLVESIY